MSQKRRASTGSRASRQELELESALRTGDRFARSGQIAKAAPIYQRVLERAPNHPGAQARLAELAFATNSFEMAAGLAQRAYASQPDGPHASAALLTLGRALQVMRKPAPAAEAFRRAATLDPASTAAHDGLGTALLALGDRDAAIASFQAAIGLEPQHPHARHMLDSLAASPRGNADYVRDLFDDYAGYFDQHLPGKLGYRAPADMRRAVSVVMPNRTFDLALDLGCGTGLVAEAFRDCVAAIDGVDISPRMVEVARAKGLYRHLHVAEIETHLAGATGRYDLVTAGDTFIYVGELAATFGHVARLVLPGGLFVFTYEVIDGDGVAIQSSARFAHAKGYIDRLARESGFDPLSTTDVIIRTENAAPIPGAVAVLQRRQLAAGTQPG